MKKVFYDIIPNEKRSIRNIPLQKKGAVEREIQDTLSVDGIRSKSHIKINEQAKNLRKNDVASDNDSEEDTEDNDSQEESFDQWRSHKPNSFWRAWVALVVLLGVGVLVFSIYFSSATIRINPIKHDFVLQETNIALSAVGHESASTELSESKEVTANGTVKVDRKATGKIILYNAYNSSTQKLVGETRLETPNGLVYKLKTTVTIPAQKTVAGKTVPGSIEAEVIASEPGEKYNQEFKDFNIVAYKGSDRYEKIYGRSKTALTNGFSGAVPNILEKDVTSAVAEIKEKIQKDADAYFTKKAEEKGKTFVYLPNTKQLTFGTTKQEASKDGKIATIKISAKAEAVLFDSASLFEQIIKKQTEDGGSANASDTKEIVYTGDLSKLNLLIDGETRIQVSGTTTISSAIDNTKVTRAVSGLSREQALGAITRLVELETIEIDIRPWWNKKLPSADKIKIQIEG